LICLQALALLERAEACKTLLNPLLTILGTHVRATASCGRGYCSEVVDVLHVLLFDVEEHAAIRFSRPLPSEAYNPIPSL
jgi:hypothetical protein